MVQWDNMVVAETVIIVYGSGTVMSHVRKYL